MSQKLDIPLQFIAQQRKIAQITNNEEILKEAMQMCQLIQLIDNNTVRVYEFPTLKFNAKFKDIVNQISKSLKQENRNTLVYDVKEDNEVYLSLLEKQETKILEQIVHRFDKNLEYKVADFYQDIKIGTAKIRKLKEQNKKNLKNEKYSLDKPPAIFIRRAVQSSQQDQENIPKISNKTKKQLEKEKEKEKKYRQKPIINQDEFPTLS